MLFTVDIGNTTVAIAGLEGERVAFVKKLPSDPGLDWTAALRQRRKPETLAGMADARRVKPG